MENDTPKKGRQSDAPDSGGNFAEHKKLRGLLLQEIFDDLLNLADRIRRLPLTKRDYYAEVGEILEKLLCLSDKIREFQAADRIIEASKDMSDLQSSLKESYGPFNEPVEDLVRSILHNAIEKGHLLLP